jgi:hypothetical protein
MNATVLLILGVVFFLGCFGGYVNWLFFKEEPPDKRASYRLRYKTGRCDTHFPGLPTNLLLGGLGAVVFWCFHGPYSGAVLIGTDPGTVSPSLTIGQIPISFLIGMSGGNYLLKEAQNRCKDFQIQKLKGSRGCQ